MLDKFLQDKSNIKEEHVEEAYTLLKKYCDENNENLLEFVKNKDNIEKASNYIYKELPMMVRLILKPGKIAQLIEENHDFIVEKAKQYTDLEKKKNSKNKKNKS